MIQVGSRVMLNVPENKRLHGTEATVKHLEEWGAYVDAPAAATNEFRALWSEMVLPNQHHTNGHHTIIVASSNTVTTNTEINSASIEVDADGFHRVKKDPNTVGKAVAAGFTGDSCDRCGSMNMVRTGSCQTCQDCGAAGSCG